VALESSNIILPESLLSRKIKDPPRHKALFVAAEDEEEIFDRGMEDILVSLETDMIRHALQRTGGSKMKAAALLKISFRSLRYKTKKYEID